MAKSFSEMMAEVFGVIRNNADDNKQLQEETKQLRQDLSMTRSELSACRRRLDALEKWTHIEKEPIANDARK